MHVKDNLGLSDAESSCSLKVLNYTEIYDIKNTN